MGCSRPGRQEKALLYVAGRLFGGRLGGWTAAIIFQFFPNWFDKMFHGGYEGGWSAIFIVAAVLFLARGRWWMMVPLCGLAVLAYPSGVIQIWVTMALEVFLFDVVQNGGLSRLRDPTFWRRRFAPLAAAAAVVVLLVSFKYLTPNEFGDLVTRVEIGERIEFTSKGRGYLIPTDPLLEDVEDYYGDPFHYVMLIGAFVFLGRRMLSLPRGVGALFLSALILYCLADVLMLRLYFPSRYLRRALPIVACLAGPSPWPTMPPWSLPSPPLCLARSRGGRLMITTFYPFSEVPFGKDLPPSELLSTPAFDELAHRLEYLRHRRGLM